MQETVAIVGSGLMGGSMARALHGAGFPVTAYDVDPVPLEALRAEGIATTGALDEALAGAGVIVNSLPNAAILRAAWMAPGGVLEHARPGTLVIETSTIDPETMKALAEACAARGLRTLDVPVSGGPAEARAGQLVLLVGGDPADIERAAPILDALGASRHHTGPVGTAKVVKLVNNVMSMGNVLVAAEAFAFGVAAGVDEGRLFDVLSQSGGRSHHFLKRFPNALRRNYDPGFKMSLGEKDVALAVEVARGLGQPMPAASLIREIFQMAIGLGYRDRDVVALLDLYQRMGASEDRLAPDS
jgi:3-hydroxyisobutyrate dehydrogenase